MEISNLTLSERKFLDDVNVINKKLEKNETQSLWNVCWGYVHGKFNESLLNEDDKKIKEVLKEINRIAPRVISDCCSFENEEKPVKTVETKATKKKTVTNKTKSKKTTELF